MRLLLFLLLVTILQSLQTLVNQKSNQAQQDSKNDDLNRSADWKNFHFDVPRPWGAPTIIHVCWNYLRFVVLQIRKLDGIGSGGGGFGSCLSSVCLLNRGPMWGRVDRWLMTGQCYSGLEWNYTEPYLFGVHGVTEPDLFGVVQEANIILV